MLDVLQSLKVGQVVTLISGGMPSTETLKITQPTRILENGNAQIIFKRKGKRKEEGFTFKPNAYQVALFDGEVQSTESIWNISKADSGIIVKEMKFAMYDPRLFRLLVKGISQKPLVLIDNREVVEE